MAQDTCLACWSWYAPKGFPHVTLAGLLTSHRFFYLTACQRCQCCARSMTGNLFCLSSCGTTPFPVSLPTVLTHLLVLCTSTSCHSPLRFLSPFDAIMLLSAEDQLLGHASRQGEFMTSTGILRIVLQGSYNLRYSAQKTTRGRSMRQTNTM
jgi:hypothetical protein